MTEKIYLVYGETYDDIDFVMSFIDKDIAKLYADTLNEGHSTYWYSVEEVGLV